MTCEEIEEMLKPLGLPLAYWQFDDDNPPTVPYIVYTLPNSSPFYADGKPYFNVDTLQIELYVEKKSKDYEERIQKILIEKGLGYQRTEIYIETEKLFVEIYNLEV